MRFLRTTLAIAALAAPVGALGCGGDDDGGEALSPEEYAQQGGEIRQTFGEESTRLGTELQAATSAEELDAGVGEVQEVTQTSIDELEALDPPEEAAEEHEALIGVFEDYAGVVAELKEATESGDRAAIQEAGATFQAEASGLRPEIEEAISNLQDAGIPLEGISPPGTAAPE